MPTINLLSSLNEKEVKEIRQLYLKNTIIFGENSSGKTSLLRKIVESFDVIEMSQSNCGLIVIPITRISPSILIVDEDSASYLTDTNISDNYLDIISRMNLENKNIFHNIYDVPNSYDSRNSEIISFALIYSSKIKVILKEIFLKEIDLQNFRDQSDGYKSVVSIISSLIFHESRISNDREKTKFIVLIDEIDAYIHIKIQTKILNVLVKHFTDFTFIVTTHSPTVVRFTSEFDLIHVNIKGSELEWNNIGSYYSKDYSLVYSDIFDVQSELSSTIVKLQEFKDKLIHSNIGPDEVDEALSLIEISKLEEIELYQNNLGLYMLVESLLKSKKAKL